MVVRWRESGNVKGKETTVFVDEARIGVRGGKGGRGCVSFRREKYVPRGGPDGGDGGDGGSVIFRATAQRHTLLDVAQRATYVAENGRPGEGNNRHGRNGRDVVVEVPVGTLVHNEDADNILCDLCADGQEHVVAPGGRGGRGNKAFATSTNRAPVEFEEGGEGIERRVYLELKLIADAGLIGLPNAGKSTLLSRLSKAHPKVAAYPFTTLEPQLGVMETSDYRQIVLADLPGLVEGAHEGAGLGDEFLRHIERTRVLVHLVDVGPAAMSPPVAAYETIRRELSEYSEKLARKAEIVVATKIDTGGRRQGIAALEERVARPVLAISAVTGEGLGKLVQAIIEELDECS